jgi:hypothetical protein
MMLIEDAQADMRHAFFGGATGIFASSLAWFVAAGVSQQVSPRAGIVALFLGGMLIHPAAMLFSKLLGRPGVHRKGNPLARLAIASTIWLLLAIPLAFALSFQKPEWFFAAMLLTIGGRYFTFETLYGLRVYWACGAALALAACGLVALNAGSAVSALTGAVIELTFALIVFKWGHSPEGKRGQTPFPENGA